MSNGRIMAMGRRKFGSGAVAAASVFTAGGILLEPKRADAAGVGLLVTAMFLLGAAITKASLEIDESHPHLRERYYQRKADWAWYRSRRKEIREHGRALRDVQREMRVAVRRGDGVALDAAEARFAALFDDRFREIESADVAVGLVGHWADSGDILIPQGNGLYDDLRGNRYRERVAPASDESRKIGISLARSLENDVARLTKEKAESDALNLNHLQTAVTFARV